MRANSPKKQQAILLRRQGLSYPEIEMKLGVPRSTLSGWMRDISLNKKARERIIKRKERTLKIARGKATALRHTLTRTQRDVAQREAETLLGELSLSREVNALILSALYLGEGFKRKSLVALGNANPDILLLFLRTLRGVFHVEEKRLRCFLYLRHDQDQTRETRYWSRILKIPLGQFRKAQHDRRTLGKKTWKGYHGVCAVYCYDARIEKTLTALQAALIQKIARAVSSAG